MSGMRTTSALHIGNYHGALKQWLELQKDYDGFYGAMNWHARPQRLGSSVREMPQSVHRSRGTAGAVAATAIASIFKSGPENNHSPH